MTPSEPLSASARGVALAVLSASESGHVDELLSRELGRSNLSAKDRQLVTELAQGTLRWRGRLDFFLRRWFKGDYRRADTRLKNILRLGLYQVLYLDRIPDHAAVDTSVDLAKQLPGAKAASLVNAILRRAIRERDSLPEPDSRNRLESLSIAMSHPEWLVKRWADRFGWKDTEAFCRVNNSTPDLWVRWNPLKTDQDSFLAILHESRITAEPSAISPHHVLIHDNLNVAEWKPFRDGLCTVQDVSAGLPVMLLDPQPGETILDFCAAPGGKATQIEETMGDQGFVIAQDVSPDRIVKVRQNIERLGLSSICCLVGDGSTLRGHRFDRILLDVPCSGLGVLRSRPDIRWKRSPEDIRFMASIQRTILETAADLAKREAVIVYSTCTTEPEENWEQIDRFLLDHPQWWRDKSEQWVSPTVVNPRGEIETYPHIHNMDGSFAVRLVRS
jgi:16S rRNA (cytosine967-C5)-methyltransferase